MTIPLITGEIVDPAPTDERSDVALSIGDPAVHLPKPPGNSKAKAKFRSAVAAINASSAFGKAAKRMMGEDKREGTPGTGRSSAASTMAPSSMRSDTDNFNLKDLVIPFPDWVEEVEKSLEKEMVATNWENMSILSGDSFLKRKKERGPSETFRRSQHAARRLLMSPLSRFRAVVIAVEFIRCIKDSSITTRTKEAEAQKIELEDALNFQSQMVLSWLSRTLRLFFRTVVSESHQGLKIDPKSLGDKAKWGLTNAEKLCIRLELLTDLLNKVEAPAPVSNFVLKLPTMGTVYFPSSYLTSREKAQLVFDNYGGTIIAKESWEQQLIAAGIILVRNLLGKLICGYLESLKKDKDPGALQARKNLQSLGSVLYKCIAAIYSNAVSAKEMRHITEMAYLADELSGFYAAHKGFCKNLGKQLQAVILKIVRPADGSRPQTAVSTASATLSKFSSEAARSEVTSLRSRSGLLDETKPPPPPEHLDPILEEKLDAVEKGASTAWKNVRNTLHAAQQLKTPRSNVDTRVSAAPT